MPNNLQRCHYIARFITGGFLLPFVIYVDFTLNTTGAELQTKKKVFCGFTPHFSKNYDALTGLIPMAHRDITGSGKLPTSEVCVY